MGIWHSVDQTYFKKGPFISFQWEFVKISQYIQTKYSGAKFSMDQYELKNLGQGSSNKI